MIFGYGKMKTQINIGGLFDKIMCFIKYKIYIRKYKDN